jgi:predicted enzyme related to lactoylglutathione lyase
MSEHDSAPPIGAIAWTDLTVEAAEEVKEFYESVVGWRSEAVDMKGYSDFNMFSPQADAPTAGICHARGGNAGLPAQWLLYLIVADLDASLEECSSRGGKVLRGAKSIAGYGRYAVIADPAGAAVALFEPSGEDG